MAVNDRTWRLHQGMRVTVDAAVDTASRDLIRAWGVAWNEVADAWAAAIDELLAMTSAGKWPSRAQIRKAARAKAALDATRTLLTEQVRAAGGRVLEAVPDLLEQTRVAQAQIVAAQFPAEAGTFTDLSAKFDRVDPAAIDSIVHRTTEQITALTQPLSAQATAVIRSELVRGVALGTNPRQAAARMMARVQGGFNGARDRALVIARTEMLDAHRAASHAQHTANQDVLAGWVWCCSLSGRTCPSCLAKHGTVHGFDETLDDHQQGRCTALPKTRTWAELGFHGIDEPADVIPDARAWFDEQPEGVQLQIMGPARLDLLRSGQVGWDDLSRVRHTDGWRSSWVPTSVADLQAKAA